MTDKSTSTPATDEVAPVSAEAPPTSITPAVDSQAQVDAALAEQSADFAEQLKQVTGYASLKDFNEAKLKEEGKTQELLDNKSKEAATYKARFESSQIKTAILSAGSDAVDNGTLVDLLAGKAVCDEHGKVTINGKPVADAIKQLLTDKPFLAKPSGNNGSGATTANSTAAVKNPFSKDHFNLTEQLTLQSENPTLAATLKAQAGA